MEIPAEQQIVTVQTPESRLSERESIAYGAWKRIAATQPKLSPDTQARFFALFLQGATCQDIVSLNKGYSLGQIVQVRMEGDWDKRRDDYLEDLLNNARGLVQQTAMESIRFVADQLAAVHKRWGESAKRYVQDGDESKFKDFGIDGIRDYKTAIEVLQKLTGQENKPQEVHHSGEIAVAPVRRPLTSKEAAGIVRAAVSVKK